MAEQQLLLTQGFHQQEKELQEQIKQLREEQAQREQQEARLREEKQERTARETVQVGGATPGR